MTRISSFVTRYRNYFDATWKFGVQLALALAFVVAFWLTLLLGAQLFKLINLDFLERLIEHSWFADPATALAIAAAIHLTDVRAGLVAGIRTVVLTLLSWLLPLMALLALGFVGSLIFTGLDPLWQTRSAAGIMLTAAGVLVVLINAAYQDGEAEGARPFVLRYAELVASALLVPLVGLAAYALALRVQQYGWSVERIATFGLHSRRLVLCARLHGSGFVLAARRAMDVGAGVGQCLRRVPDPPGFARPVHAGRRSGAAGGAEPGVAARIGNDHAR